MIKEIKKQESSLLDLLGLAILLVVAFTAICVIYMYTEAKKLYIRTRTYL